MADRRNLQKYPPILFDEARRREFIDPEALIAGIGLKAGMTVADFGAGAGFFSVPAAKSVGRRGSVYAVDINPNNLSIIHGKARHESVASRVKLIEGNVETGQGLKIKAASTDAVILSSVLSQFTDKTAVLKQAATILKTNGRLVVFEWHDRSMLLGPPNRARIAKEDVINLLMTGGEWKLESDLEAGFYNYCLIFSRRGGSTAPVKRKRAVAKATA